MMNVTQSNPSDELSINCLHERTAVLGGARNIAYLFDMSRFMRSVRLAVNPARLITRGLSEQWNNLLNRNKKTATDEITGKAVAAYCGLAVGDALGATVEFMLPSEIVHAYGVHKKIIGGGWLKLRPGQVTDDTTMALALGEAILNKQRFDITDMAMAFDKWLKGKPVDVGNTVRRGIVNFRNTKRPISPESEHDAGNGACMRVLPVALATYGADEELTKRVSRMQSHVTHNNDYSDAAIDCVVSMIHMAFDGDDKKAMEDGPVAKLLEAFPKYRYDKKHQHNPSAYIVDTMRAVFQSFFHTQTFEDCLIEVVNRGGDADTTGAIVGMIAGAYYGLDSIPHSWLKAVDRDVIARCRYQAEHLIDFSKEFATNRLM